MSHPRTAAVFATMNRAPTAVECVRALAAQTRPPDLVVVADNCSSDNTVAAVEAITGLPFELILHKMRENRGNAGGVEEAMDLAFDRGADAVWILDDDSWPRPGALAALLERPGDGHAVRHALQVDPRTERLTWPMWVESGSGWSLVSDESGLPPGPLLASRASWTGAMISRHVREAVGPVNGALFIRGEDEEYPWRVSQAGFRFECVRDAVLDHPGPLHMVRWRLFGKHLFYERGLADWKLYYKVRNMIWIKRRQSGRFGAMAVGLCYALAALRFDGAHRMPLIFEAARDGWRGKLGKWRKQ